MAPSRAIFDLKQTQPRIFAVKNVEYEVKIKKKKMLFGKK